MERLKAILVAVDCSDCSLNALSFASGLGECHGAGLHVVHVVDRLVLQDLLEALGDSLNVEATLRADLLKRFQDAARDHGAGGADLDVMVGSPLDQIIRKVASVDADLLVLGTRGELKAIRESPTLVLLVEPHHTLPFRDVVVCIDFSDISARLVELACRMVVPEGRLTLLHVYVPPWYKMHYRAPTPEASPGFQTQYRRALTARLESYLEHVPENCRSTLRCRPVLHEHANHGRGILEFLRQEQADLAVVGTKGRTSLKYVLLGSIAKRVVRDTPCSLLAVKPADFKIKIE